MSYARHAVKVLGVCLVAALGLMALGAAGAQAKWTVNGAGIGAGKPTVLGHTLGISQLLTSVGAIKVEIQCELMKVEGYLTETPALTIHATFTASKNCKTFLNLVENVKCKPLEPITMATKGKLILHNGTTYILFEPLTSGQPFVTKHLGEGTCAIGLNFPITGSFVAECVVVTCTQEAVSHPLRVVLPGLFPNDTLLFGANQMSLHAEFSLHLGGPNTGQNWSGVG